MMRKAALVLLVAILILVAGCGGNGGPTTPPPPQDLSAIQGTWNYVLNYNGVMEGGGESIPYNEQDVGFFLITSNTVMAEGLYPFVWDYDGLNLKLSYTSSSVREDEKYGTLFYDRTTILNMQLAANYTSTNVTGTLEGSIWGANAPFTIYLHLIITGNFTKR